MTNGIRLCLVFSLVLRICSSIQWDVFSTKTSYFWAHNSSQVHGDAEVLTLGNLACKAVHLNFVARHGARNPTDGSIGEIRHLHTKIVTHKDPAKYPELDTWTDRYDVRMEGELVPMGTREQEALGKTYGRMFHALLGNNLRRLQFLTSRKRRTIDSARGFYNGLASQFNINDQFVSHVNDSLMRFYEGCARYEISVSENATNFQQYQQFSKTSEFHNVSDRVMRRLGLKTTFTPEELYTLYDLCAYETYIFNDQRWCSVMTDQERRVLEYGMDVQNYHESMYGNPMNERVACPLVRDVFHTMDSVIRTWNSSGSVNTGYVVGKFQFGHSETVGKLLTALGLFRDQSDFLATNMAAMENRKFRSSLVLPYSANVVFVLYNCGTSGGATSTFYLRLLVNEETVAFPICGGKDLCPYETARKAYASVVDNCDEKLFCSLKTQSIVGR